MAVPRKRLVGMLNLSKKCMCESVLELLSTCDEIEKEDSEDEMSQETQESTTCAEETVSDTAKPEMSDGAETQ